MATAFAIRIAALQKSVRQQRRIMRRHPAEIAELEAEPNGVTAPARVITPVFEATRISPASVSSPSASYPLQARALSSLTAYRRG